MKFDMILAIDEKNWIGKANSLPWNIPSDLNYFHNITTDTEDLWKMNAVIMWKNTWNSIETSKKPLSDRINCILSHKLWKSDIGSPIDDFVLYFESFEHCLSELESKENVENIFVIWWGDLFNYSLNSEFLDKIYITKIKWDYKAEIFFGWIPENFHIISYTDWENENWYEFRHEIWEKIKK